jgi:hypothetical protein
MAPYNSLRRKQPLAQSRYLFVSFASSLATIRPALLLHVLESSILMVPVVVVRRGCKLLPLALADLLHDRCKVAAR